MASIAFWVSSRRNCSGWQSWPSRSSRNPVFWTVSGRVFAPSVVGRLGMLLLLFLRGRVGDLSVSDASDFLRSSGWPHASGPILRSRDGHEFQFGSRPPPSELAVAALLVRRGAQDSHPMSASAIPRRSQYTARFGRLVNSKARGWRHPKAGWDHVTELTECSNGQHRCEGLDHAVSPTTVLTFSRAQLGHSVICNVFVYSRTTWPRPTARPQVATSRSLSRVRLDRRTKTRCGSTM